MRLHDLLDNQARQCPDAPFAVQGERCTTYAEARAQTDRLAAALAGAGLEVGDRIALLAKNSIEYILLYFAASKVGVVPVPLNYRLAPAEWAYIIADAGARMILAGGEFVAGVDSIRGGLPDVQRYIAYDTAGALQWEEYNTWLVAAPSTFPDRAITPDHDVYQMYTSGTTGHPKGL